MTIVSYSLEVPEERMPYEDVLALGPGESGASPRGSTYWGRVQHCPREHLLANVLKWSRRVRAKALDWGLLWHGCLESYYKAVLAHQQGRPLDKVPERYAFEFLQLFRDAEGWDEVYAGVTRMLDAYFERWKADRNAWEILAVEYTCGWTAQTRPDLVQQLGFEQTTRLDLVIRDWTLRPVVRHVEHKSASALDPQTILGYAQDDQVLGQCYLARFGTNWAALGAHEPYMGALVNVTTKAQSPRCERLPVQPSDTALGAWADSKRYWAWQRDQYEVLGYPRNYVSCTRRYGRCEFYEACRQYPEDTVVTLRAKNAAGDLPANYVHRDAVIGLEDT